MSTSAPAGDSQVTAWLAEEYLQREAPRLLDGQPAARRVDVLAEDVWEIEFADGRKLVAKQQVLGFLARRPSQDLLAVEEKVLGLLIQDGCPVPRHLGSDRAEQFIFLEHVGERTLDDLVQEDGGASSPAYVRRAIVGLDAIDHSCSRHQKILEPLVPDAVNKQALQVSWQAAGQRAKEGLEALHRHRGDGSPSAGTCEELGKMGSWLASRPPLLGSTDYNARNLVVDKSTGDLHFIEFAKIGYDWTERRLVQYTSSLGSGRDDGCLFGLLDAGSAGFYQEHSGRPDGARALDYHHIYFLLNGAALLCRALEAPAADPGARLLSLWRNPERRLFQFAAHLSRELSADPLARSFRSGLKLSTN